ncbi:c-type cytochrome [Modicisalibacter luteus]|uniref:C-type cytochrome n=1 Tax=Modicisalibacter luteus TaxID=453962 RepID=A0ABV7M7I9_9GAMM|nr:c-type cytochrome [Halomonas lutea]GHA89680.1 hypothetical protein GCM10007159_09110 [Halomonas lutea]
MSRLMGLAILTLGLVMSLTACDQEPMANQPKYETYEAAPEWPDNQSARDPVAGTVPRDAPVELSVSDTLPMPLTRELLERGQAQFNIYCSPCHARTGYGNGMIVQRGFPSPPSLHNDRLRNAPLRHFYDVITDGYGVMYSYADRVPPHDRWAIAAYIQALQLSQYARFEDLTKEQRAKLPQQDSTATETTTSAGGGRQ